MANVNTSWGFQSVPAQIVTVNTETVSKVPASGMIGLPNPIFASGSGLCVQVPVGAVVDGHPFRVRLVGKIHTGAAATVTPKLYQVPGSIIKAGTQGTVGNDTAVITCAASGSINGDANFIIEAGFVWDSTSGALNGNILRAQINGVNNAANSGTAGTAIATTQVTSVTSADLAFMPSFTFSVANAANSFTLSEFSIIAD